MMEKQVKSQRAQIGAQSFIEQVPTRPNNKWQLIHVVQ